MEGGADDTFFETLKDGIPLGRLGKLEEVAALYAFLASDEAQFINGHSIIIDGGQTAGPVTTCRILPDMYRYVMLYRRKEVKQWGVFDWPLRVTSADGEHSIDVEGNGGHRRLLHRVARRNALMS